MIIAWNDGHTIRGVGGGAIGIKSETGLNRPLGARVREKLKALGHTVILCNVDEGVNSLAQICAMANKQPVDLFVSNHFNAGGGQGVEVLVYNNKSTKAIEVGKRVCKEISNLGFELRSKSTGGIKYRPELMVLNSTKSEAILIETCFIDSEVDMKLYDEEKVANAIVYAITGQAPKSNNHYYVVTNYLPQNTDVILMCKHYFPGLDRVFIKHNPTGFWAETQYVTKEVADTIANKLKADNLLYRVVTE